MLCPKCYHPIRSMMLCGACNLRRHAVGADTSTTSDTTTAAAGATATNASLSGWDLIQLINPSTILPWLLDKNFDPSAVSDAQSRRTQLAQFAKQLDTSQQACSSIPSTDRTNWATFGTAFASWFNQDESGATGLVDAKADSDQADAFQDQLHDWQVEFSKYCDMGLPTIPKSNPTLLQVLDDTEGVVIRYFDTAKVAFLVGGVVVIVLVWAIGKENIAKLVAKYA